MTDVESGARGAGNRPVSVCLVTLVVYNQLRHGALTYSYFILHGCGSYVTEGHAELRAGTTVYPRCTRRTVRAARPYTGRRLAAAGRGPTVRVGKAFALNAVPAMIRGAMHIGMPYGYAVMRYGIPFETGSLRNFGSDCTDYIGRVGRLCEQWTACVNSGRVGLGGSTTAGRTSPPTRKTRLLAEQ